MKLLNNFDIFKEYYNVDTKEFCSFENLQNTVGTYKIINNIMTGLLINDNKLYFFYGEDKFLITDSHKASIVGVNNISNEFNLMLGNELQAKFFYSLPDSKLNVSPFEYIDDEDFKWGDFIAKIINDPERKRNFIMNLAANK